MTWEAILKAVKFLKANQRRRIIEYMTRNNNNPMSASQVVDAVGNEFRQFPTRMRMDMILRKDAESPDGDFVISYRESMTKPNGDLIRLYSVREKNE